METNKWGVDISDCCNYLDSNKVTERKKRVAELKQLLESPNSIILLNENFEKDRRPCWDDVFLAVHRSLLKEIDRFSDDEKKKGKLLPATESAIRSCCGLLILIVTEANTGEPYLSCHELFSCILQVLEQNIGNVRGTFILEAYITLLGLALSSERYWGDIEFSIWKALLEVCISLLNEEISEKMKAMIMSICHVIVLQGGRMSSLILKSKKLLLLFPGIFNELVPSRYPQVELCGLQLSHTLCIQFGKEFRLSVDKFMDEILPCIMKLNDNRVSSDALFKELMSQLLIEIVNLKTCKSGWLKEACSLLKFVDNELSDISRHKLSFTKPPKVIMLGVKLAKYITKEGSMKGDYCGNEPKRRKTNSCIGALIDNLNLYSDCLLWPWLCYMDCLLDKAPEVVLEEDIIPLMEYFSKNLTQSNDTTCLRYLTKSSLRLLNISKKGISEKHYHDYLNVLWTSAVRCVNHPALTEVGLILVSGLLSDSDWIREDSALIILGFYLDRKIIPTKASLAALSQLSAAGLLSTTNIRINLIKWYLSSEVYCTETLLSIIIRSKFPPLIPSHHTEFPLSEINKFHIVASLGTVPEWKTSLIETSLEDVIENQKVSMEFMTLLSSKLNDLQSLQESLDLIISLLSLLDCFKKYSITIATRLSDFLITAVPELIVHFKEYLSAPNPDDDISLILKGRDFFEEMAKFPNVFVTYNDSQDLINILLEILKRKHILICSNLEKPALKLTDVDYNCEETSKDGPPTEILSSILALSKSYNSEDKIKTYFHLIEFCKCNFSLSSKSGFQMVYLLLNHILHSKVGTKELIRNVLSLIKKVCSKWFMYYEEVLKILQLFYDIIKPMLEYDRSQELKGSIHQLLSSFMRHIVKKRYGPEIIVKYISVLACISGLDPDGIHRIDHGDGKKQHVLESLLEFLNSPFHQVRIATSEHICDLFSGEILSVDRNTLLSHAFSNILLIVGNLFLVKEGLTTDEVKEEALNRTFCVLKIYLGLICSSPLWRRKALYELFNTIAMKRINPCHFDKLHTFLETNLKIENCISFFENNLDYILWEWYKTHKSFENIPHLLLKHENIENFYSEYKSIIVPIFLESLNLVAFQDFCNHLHLTPLEVAIECFPEIFSCLIPKLGTDLEVAEEMHKLFSHILGSKLKDLISAELKRVLLNVFMKLSDSNYFKKLCDLHFTPILPTPTPSNITSKGIENALAYIQRTTPMPQEFLLIFLCNKYPSYIQYIMHNLLSHVHMATTKEIRSLCFLQYIALVDGIISQLDKIKSLDGFIVRQTFHSLLHFLNSDIGLVSIHYLFRLIEVLLKMSTSLVNYFISIIYPEIFKLSQGNDPKAHVAKKIRNLLLEAQNNLPNLIPLLPPKETFASLSEEINNIIERKTIDFQTLNQLSQQISDNHKELLGLYEEVKKLKYTSEDCASSLIHKLISKLITIAASSDSQARTSAAQCLGKIGPRNLNTLALQPDLHQEPPALAKQVVSLLLPLLVNNDIETCELAVIAVIEALGTVEGMEAFRELSLFEKSFLTPFIYHNKELKNFSEDYSVQKLAWASMQNSEDQKLGWGLWSGSDHSEWIRMLVSRLLASFNSGFLPLLAPIAAKEVEVSEVLLPYVVYIIIKSSDLCSEGITLVQKNLSCFFENHYRLLNLKKQKEGTSIYFNRKSVQCMLSIVNFCRIKTASLAREEWMNYLRLLKVDFLHVAYAAQFCRAYFTSLLYAEIWAEFMKEDIEKELPKHITLAPLELICRTNPEDGLLILNLLWENYKEIGERDSVESCARLLINDPVARLRYFKEMGLWQQLIAEAEIEDDQEALSYGHLMSGMFNCASHIRSHGWEAAWRLTQWDIEQPQKENDDFSSLHYSALRSILHLKDKQAAFNFLETARKLVLDGLAHVSLEVAAPIYFPLAKLQLISEMERWCANQEVNEHLPDADWIHVEPLLLQRGILQGSAEQWLSSAKIAKLSSAPLIAKRLLKKIKNSETSNEIRNEAKFEEAQIHWGSGNHEAAKFLMKNVLNSNPDAYLKSQCLLKYGTWMSETKSLSAKEIIGNFFEKASDLNNGEGRLEAAECLAKFSDAEFQRLDGYLSSTEFENKVSQMRDTSENLKALQSCPPSQLNLEEKKSSKIYQCNLDADKAEIEKIRLEHSAFLRLAVREYLFTLQFDSTTSDKMFRFVSLWLANNRMACLKEELNQHLNNVPTYRFIQVFPQLSVRMSVENNHFSRTLSSLLERCAIEHPHHCLWHLLALSNAEKDQPKTDTPSPPRVQGAIRLIRNLLKNSDIASVVCSMQDLAHAYISFANLELPKTIKPGESYKIPRSEKLREMKDLTHISSATVSIPINKSANYTNIPGMLSIQESFQIAGGINQPKKIKVHCSDGKIRTELVKGRDDIRQDALMQQVFSVLNTLLEADPVTSRRRLNIRTYKVVPMTQKSGVIEWCSNTEPLGSYLSQAHARHRPQDLSQTKCKIKLNNVAQSSNEEKLEMFKLICSKFKPIMRHFFLERYLTPGVWYEKRLAYTRSVATNSMIGYVMGIGDRHVFNILIDNETAEVVHIDFGISFELGKILPTPETVPFRLTRDIEDGMGVTGVEGAFRKCCEETMRVMREKSEPIITTLEALLYDPLYSWSVKKTRSEQSQQSIPDISMDETNKLAERFLQRLKLKLKGCEESSVTSIDAQVRNLIQEAKDFHNLSRLFRGWQAYL